MTKPRTMAARKIVSLTPDLAKALADYRLSHRIPSEAQAIRQLIGLGLAYYGAADLLREARKLGTRRRLYDDDEQVLDAFRRRVDEHLGRLGNLTVSEDEEAPS